MRPVGGRTFKGKKEAKSMRNPYRSLRAGLAVLSAAAFLAFSPANVLAEETLTSQTGQAVQQTEAAQQTGAA